MCIHLHVESKNKQMNKYYKTGSIFDSCDILEPLCHFFLFELTDSVVSPSCSLSLLYSVQFNSVTQSCLTLCDPMNRSTPGLFITLFRSSLRLTSIESVMSSSHLILGRPLLLPPIPPSIRVFSNESTLLLRWQNTGVSALASSLPKKSQG